MTLVGDPAAGRVGSAEAARRRSEVRTFLAVLAALVIVAADFAGITARLFLWPRSDRVTTADAIVVLNGRDAPSRNALADRLAGEHRAPVLLVSLGSWWNYCPKLPEVQVVCFVPRPERTIGEIRYAAAYARAHHLKKLIFVAGHSQVSRTRLLARRCYPGPSQIVGARTTELEYDVAYEWGATVKSLFLDRGCT